MRRDNLAKLDHLPLIQRVPSAPELKTGQRIRLSIEAVDYLTLELSCRYTETLDPAENDGEEISEETAEAID